MGELKKIVVDDVPAEQLPEIVRRRIEGSPAEVRVTIEFDATPPTVPRRSLRSFLGCAPGLYSSTDEVVGHIRNLRDESDR